METLGEHFSQFDSFEGQIELRYNSTSYLPRPFPPLYCFFLSPLFFALGLYKLSKKIYDPSLRVSLSSFLAHHVTPFVVVARALRPLFITKLI
uniref:Uncharacterized protein n=1 Tax=Strigamia maritima TaxID=126957 RepID=T1IW17_STRMM